MGGGGGGQVTGYNYQAAIIIGVCEGPVSGTGVVWKDKERTTLAALGLSLYPGDATPGAPWGYLSSYHPQEAIRYPGLAYVCAPLFSLGSSADVPNLTFEVVGPGRLAGFADAQPDYIITDFIKNSRYGAAPSFSMGNLIPYGDYCRAMGLFISPAFTEQKEAAEYLREIAQCTNSEYVWSQGVLNLIPYADAPVSGNGYSYTPDITPIYDLTDDDFCTTDEDPVKCSRITTADAYNHVQVEFVNRNKDYNVEIADAKDQADIEAKGLRTKDPVKLHHICDPAVARIVAQSLLQRELYVRNSYQFRLSWKHCLLEPMDLVTITDTGMGLDKLPVRISEIEEDEDGYLTVTAVEWPFGVGTTARYPYQNGLGYVPDYQVSPGDSHTPTVFEPPFSLTDNIREVWLATSGGDNWGGCQVWVSRDGATYTMVGTITGGHRHGTITDTLASGLAIDTVNTMRVQLFDSDRQLQAATQQEADELRTLMWVDGELIAYQNASLVSSGVYDLTYLVRGAHNSVIGVHNSGARWARLDGTLFRVPYPPDEIGRTIHIKLCSYNVYGVALQNLDEVPAHTYTITNPPYVPPILTITAKSTLYTTITPGIYKSRLDIAWTDLSPRIGMYDVEILDDGAVIWSSRVYQPSVRVDDLSAGDRQVRVRGVNSLGVPGEWNTQDARVVAKEDPPGPVTNAGIEVVRGQASIYWTAVPDVDVAGYSIQLGTEWDAPGNKVLVDGYTGTSFPWTPDRTGIISILIKARDNSGHWSVDAFRLDYQVMSPGKPLAPSARVVDHMVELSWSPAQPGTFPVAYYRIYSGADFATAVYRGRADVNTMVLMEPSGGTYKYWLVAVDVAELAGPETGIYVKVDAPADYVLYANQSLDLAACTLTNAVIEAGEIVLPVNTTETFEQHFTAPGWDQPQDQIDAGRPIFAQSGTNWANVEKIIDLGAVIAASKITVSVTRQTAVGTVVISPRISASADGTTWSDLADAYEAYTQSFRYVKVLLMCSTFDNGLARIQRIDLRLDIKERTALATVNITDTAGPGTEVTFASMGIAPADVIAIIPTAPYTGTAADPITVLPNFTDVPNPTSFRLLAYDKNSARVAVNGVKALVRYVA